jgi:membrane protease subunit HflC
VTRPALIAAAIGGLALIIVAFSSIFVVNQYEMALVMQFGEPRRVIDEPGLKFKIPFVQNVVFFDKRVLNFDTPSEEVPTVDQKQVIVEAFAKFRIVDPLRFFQTVYNEQGVQARLRSIISSNLRRALGDVPMSVVLTDKRPLIMRDMTQLVNKEADGFGIKVIDVRVKRIDLPDENAAAIFRRMQTQREQEARRIRAEGGRDAQTIKAEADKQQVVIRAEAQQKAETLRGEGDAAATATYNQAYGRDPSFFDFYRSMQALSTGLPPSTTSYVGPATGSFFRYFGTADSRPPGGPGAAPPPASSAPTAAAP